MMGWIKLHRILKEKPIWKKSTPEQKTIFITLLLMINHKQNEWEWEGQKFNIMPGQMVTSLESIQREAGKGISIQNVRTALKKFEKYGFLTNKSTKTGRLITIVNWQFYQSINNEPNKDDNKDLTNSQQRDNKEVTPNKNDKNDKNEINNIIILNPEEEQFLKVLEMVENYPIDRKKDLDMYKRLKERYPELDLLESIEDFAVYKQDNPLKAKDNPRSQINTSFKKYVQWGKNLIDDSSNHGYQSVKPKQLYQVDSS